MYKLIFSLLVVSIVCGCSRVKVTNDYDSAVDFSTMKTYAWLQVVDSAGNDARINNSLVKDTVREAVEKVLKEKGYVKAETENVDFQISWLGAIDKKVTSDSINHFYRPYGYGALYRDPQWNKDPTLAVREYEEGTLIIDFLDPENHSLIWRGEGSEKISEEKSHKEAKQVIHRVVSQILKQFPPNK